MKKAFLIFIRVIFVLVALMVALYYGAKTYFLHQSSLAIEKSVVADNSPVIGDANSPYPIVEFFDYSCPHCAAMSRMLTSVTEGDKETKIILRPVAFIDDDSMKIATLVLAADKQLHGSGEDLHLRLMVLDSPPSYDVALTIAKDLGLDIVALEKSAPQFEPLIEANMILLRDVGFPGVPAVIFGDKGYFPQGPNTSTNEIRLMILDSKKRMGIGQHE